ncbi:MAG: SMR family transporter [Candidatus Margulisiibacteriota bacterium]|jgi:multidrug transporter EmrE-like cation transporter
MKSVILVLVPVLIGIVGQILLKKGMLQIGQFGVSPGELWPILLKMITNIYVIFGMLLYAVSAFLWLIVLSRMELSFAYPLLSTGYIFILLFSWLFFKEQVSLVRWSGVGVIWLGVYLISRS